MKSKKTWIIISLACIAAGSLLMTAGCLLGGIPGFYIDQTGIHPSRDAVNETNIFKDSAVLEEFDNIQLDLTYADVEILPSDRFAVEYRITNQAGAPTCKVENNKLIFKEHALDHETSSRIWFMYNDPAFNSSPEKCYIKLEIPEETKILESRICMEYGDLTISSLYSESLLIENDYGDVTLSCISGSTMASNLHFGDLLSKELNFSSVNADNEYGDVSIRLTGEIKDYGFDLYTQYGSIYIKKRMPEIYEEETHYKTDGDKKIKIFSNSGDIEVL